MAGVKGRSGGARPNTGGARPGAGRKPNPPKLPEPPAVNSEADPVQFLLSVMQGTIEANMTQVRAAIAAAQYTNTKKHDGGKKEENAEKAEKAASKFKAAAPPRLVVNR